MILLLCYTPSLFSEIKFQISVVRRHFIQFDVKTDITFIFLTLHVSQPPRSYSCHLHRLFILFYSQVSHSIFPKLSTLSTVQSVRLVYAGQCTYLCIRAK